MSLIKSKNKEVIIVAIGEREFETALDHNGVQRFLPHDQTPEGLANLMSDWDNFLEGMKFGDTIPNGIYTPNDLAIAFHQGEWTVDEILSYQTASGYSVSGLSELSYFDDLEIRNPLWED